MARRSFFAELQHQAAVAERNRQREHAAIVREAQRQTREAERARAAAERARQAAIRSDQFARAQAEGEARRLHLAAQEAAVEAANAELLSTLADVDAVLTWTLNIDDHVDLEGLRRQVQHPPFTSRHQAPIPPALPIHVPPEPHFVEPPPPTGVKAAFGKKRHAAAVQQARDAFNRVHQAWRAEAASVPIRQFEQAQRQAASEAVRQSELAADRAHYDAACQKRQGAVDTHNARLDALISGLEIGEQSAVEEYLSIVFGNSVYPDVVSVEIEHHYEPVDKELRVTIGLNPPLAIPTARSYRYVKAKDEIAETAQPAKEQRDRYAGLLHAVVLRTMHEVWESDRRGHVETISLTAGVEHIDPATGRPTTTPLVAVAAHRSEFESINLAQVTPSETLKHLKAVVSKNPHALTPIDLRDGVRS